MKQIDINDVKEINEFIDTLSKDKTIDLSNFKEKLKSLKLYYCSIREMIKISSDLCFADACYNYAYNYIYYTDISIKFRSLYHELFHVASAFIEGSTIFNGYLEETVEDLKYFNTVSERGMGLNEGYTELLSERYFNSATQCDLERLFAKQLEKIVGAEFLKEHYFKPHGIDALIEKLSEYTNEGQTLHLIELLDIYNKLLGKNNEKELQNIWDEIVDIFVCIYLVKIKKEISTPEEATNKFYFFINCFTVCTLNKNGEVIVNLYDSLKKCSLKYNLDFQFEEGTKKIIRSNTDNINKNKIIIKK